MSAGHVVVMTTVDDEEVAETLARDLVAQRLAACVQVSTVTSHYRWEGRVERSRERLLLIKTAQARVAAVQEWVLARHPYQVPELVVVPVSGGNPAYLAWIDAAVGG